MSSGLTTFAVVAVLCLGIAGEALAQDFGIDWWTVDSGGGMSALGGDFELSGTIGQPDASATIMTGDDFELAGGFWTGVSDTFCFADLDGDLDVDLVDLAQLLGHYGTPSGAMYEDGDLDDDGDVDLIDLAELLGAYGDTCS